MVIGGAECVSENLAGNSACHDDHGAECDILHDHRDTLVLAIPRHHLGLGAKVTEVVSWRYGHALIIALSNVSRNRVSAGYSVSIAK